MIPTHLQALIMGVLVAAVFNATHPTPSPEEALVKAKNLFRMIQEDVG